MQNAASPAPATSKRAMAATWKGNSNELRSVFLRQVVEPLVARHDQLQGAIARIGVRFAAIEMRYRPRGAADFGIEGDDHHAPGMLAILEAAQLGDDQRLDLVLGPGELVQWRPSWLVGLVTLCRDERPFRQRGSRTVARAISIASRSSGSAVAADLEEMPRSGSPRGV